LASGAEDLTTESDLVEDDRSVAQLVRVNDPVEGAVDECDAARAGG
jgi:hypothetical protein